MKFKTVKENEEEFEEAFQFIENYFSDTNLQVFHHEKEGFKTLVVATDEDPNIMLHGHVDVVDADKEEFQIREENGRLYGRGSADMKSGLACIMKALKQVSDKDVSVGLMVVSDEEIGGFRGAQYLMQNKYYSPDFALSAEPNSYGDCMEIVTNQKGIMRVIVSAEGDGAHGSKPWNGENAAEKLWRKFERLKKNYTIDKQKWTTTVNLGYFESGEAMNVVPDTAKAGLDIRYTEEYPPEEVVKDLENINGLRFEVEAEDPPLKTSRENGSVQKLKEIAEKHGKVKFARERGASDLRHFSEQNIPAVVIGPIGGNIHAKNEYVEKDSLRPFYNIVKEFVEEEG